MNFEDIKNHEDLEEILLCEEVPIVPISKLNSFINEEDKGLNSPQVVGDMPDELFVTQASLPHQHAAFPDVSPRP